MEGPKNIFWGLAVKPNKRYETEVQEAFRITKACLVPSTADGKISTIMVEIDNNEEFILANLTVKNFNETLDISFNDGEKICFRVSGPGTVHLTGNLLESDEPYEDYNDETSDEEMADEGKTLDTKKQQLAELKKNGESDNSGSDNDEDDDDEEDDDDDDDDEDDDESEEDEESEDETIENKQNLSKSSQIETPIKAAKSTKEANIQKNEMKEIEPPALNLLTKM